MNWSLFVTFLVLLIPLAEWPTLKQLRSFKEWAVFGTLWGLAVLSMVGEWMGWPMPRPLDWIRAVISPIARLIP